MLLSAPFTEQIHDAGRWQSWVADLGGGVVRLVWVRTDAATLRTRLADRASGRDSAKLAAFDQFLARMRLDEEPAAPCLIVDNRLSAHTDLRVQVSALAERFAG